ncbi:hypothetical protein A5695_13670 [Mycobacterium sp. E1747]|nr:hypothetical protein A5695_13670 [Mycobacterium sp. E1747]
MDRFDYVIVGGGTAGCVLAARLSEDCGTRVALLEAGPGEGPARMSDPTAAFTLWGSDVDWGYSTEPQPGTYGAAHPYPLGRVLGGSSSINAMLHLRGHPAGYDAWQTLGAHGWNHRSLLPYLRRCERAEGRDPWIRGMTGPMTIEPPYPPSPLAQAWAEAATEAGYTASDDQARARVGAVSWADMNVVEGRRQSAADAYLRPNSGRPNLTVITRAFVTRLLMDGTRCTGAEYVTDAGVRVLRADREVLIAAGAIGSPVLLMRSGVGDEGVLRDAGIPTAHHLPGVGLNLHDHIIAGVVYRLKKPVVGPPGPLPYALCRSAADSDPDIQLILNPGPWGPRWASSAVTGYSIMFALMSPASRGTVRIRSGDPASPPLIDPGFLTDERDTGRMVAALRLAREIGDNAALDPWRDAEVSPGARVSDNCALRDFVRRCATTYFHPVGTCRMGSDDLAVVDSALRVRGMEGLRIADASVMPAIVPANTNATVLAIAERAAAIVLGAEGTHP